MQNGRDLYTAELPAEGWTAFCGGNNEEEDMETCVAVAVTDSLVAIRDTKRPELPALRFTPEEVAAFVRGYTEKIGPSA
ncbi:DUF397 domain-containing protein [Nocardiopsis potens]|uniref:DUF397 domain-containing protein n=1 Tax=Nocardiopsis potens TaxID=1246458 RepID=UPI00034D9062|nr:DUF397 domain-containing protein [Nocardiopsis potens]